MTATKIVFNNLLSRFDTLHDFCSPVSDNATARNRAKTLKKGMTYSTEFNNIFKPEILRILDNVVTNPQTKEKEISAITLEKEITKIINDDAIPKNLKGFYKQDLLNLINRTQNGLILVNNLKTVDKETYDKISSRSLTFEPTVMTYFEFLFNSIEEKDIGRFLSNKNLPIFNYIDKQFYQIFDKKYDKIYNTTNKPIHDFIDDYLGKCIANKEKNVSFILGTIDVEKDQSSGFYQTNPPFNYKRYLFELRYILGKYYEQEDDILIYLIVDTTNVSIAKYYKEYSKEFAEILKKNRNAQDPLKLKVLCNVAMNWDGATSAECQDTFDEDIKIQQKSPNKSIEHTRSNKDVRSIFALESLNLEEKTSGSTKKTIVSVSQNESKDMSNYHRTVGDLCEDIRKNIGKNDNGKFLDYKRSGDALQALMVPNLNRYASSGKYFCVFVTLDFLAFLKARINGIPTMFTSLQKDKLPGSTQKVDNRVIVLYKTDFGVNYKAIYNKLVDQYTIYNKNITNIISSKRKIDQSNWKEEILKYFIKMFFGIEKNDTNVSNDDDDDIVEYIEKLVKNHYPEYTNVFSYSNYKADSLYYSMSNFPREIEEGNKQINILKDTIIAEVSKKNSKISFGKKDLINEDLIKDYIIKYIHDAFTIESIFTLKRLKMLFEYIDKYDEKVINDIKDLIDDLHLADEDKIKSNYDDVYKYMTLLDNYNNVYKALYDIDSESFDTLFDYTNTDVNKFKKMLKDIYDVDCDSYNLLLTKEIPDSINLSLNRIYKGINKYIDMFKTMTNIKPKIRECTNYITTTLPQQMNDIMYTAIVDITETFFTGITQKLNLSKINQKPISTTATLNKIIKDAENKRQKGGGIMKRKFGVLGNSTNFPRPIFENKMPRPLVKPAVFVDKYIEQRDNNENNSKNVMEYDDDMDEDKMNNMMEEDSIPKLPEFIIDEEILPDVKIDEETDNEILSDPFILIKPIDITDVNDTFDIRYDENDLVDVEDDINYNIFYRYNRFIKTFYNISELSSFKRVDTLDTKVVSNTLRHMVGYFYDKIEKFYLDMLNNTIDFERIDVSPVQDMVIYMMINDPYTLLSHPKRTDSWSIVEKNILYKNANDIINVYATIDEYVTMICLLDDMLLYANLNIITDKYEPRKNIITGEYTYVPTNIEQLGGNNKIFTSLKDYHQKYYKLYYNLYYK